MDAPGFQPADSAQLLSDLCSDSLSFEQVAHLHGTTVTHLAAWMSRPHVAAQLDALRAAALTRARLIALQKLPAISRALTTMVVDFSERRSPAFADAADPDRRATLIARDRDAARRACWLLYRLALLTDPGTPPPRPARRPPDNSPPPTNEQPTDEHPSSTPTPRTSIEHLAPLPSSLAVPVGASTSASSKAAVRRAPTIAGSEHVCNTTTPAAPRHRVTITSSISPPLIPTAHTPRAPASPTPRTLIDTTGRARPPPPRPTHSANAAAARIDTFVLTATPPGVTRATAHPAQESLAPRSLLFLISRDEVPEEQRCHSGLSR